MTGKLFGSLAFGSMALASVMPQQGPWQSNGPHSDARLTLHGVRTPGLQHWNPSGLPVNVRLASYRDSGEPLEDNGEDDLEDLAFSELMVLWNEFGNPSAWPQP